ncbi:hypothetical protein DID88_006439 [Monilinia fructigena]|uniref:Uncharacterized protein n=1 Tax=Monilinia fructigena TaxID=38457 RepID=A0A395ID86_9HELO|nr:hypothetical protein DID88_006439 [Monilinia fructigena]
MPPKNPGGRPKKYATKAEAKAADLEKRQYRRQQARLLAGPADFIAFEPPHLNVPTDTPPSGLPRTNFPRRITSTRGGPLAAPIGISENLYPVEDSLQAFDPAVFDQPFNGHGASDEWEHMPMRLQAQDASPTLAWQFNHVIEEANLHNGPGFDSTTGFQVDGATFQIDGVTGFPVNSATCQVYGTTGSQVAVAAAVDIYANAAAAATAASTIPYQVNASAPGLFTPTIGNINSAGPALAYTSNTLLPLHVGGRYLCLLNSNKIY